MNSKVLKWFFPGVTLVMFLTFFFALLTTYVPPNLSELLSNVTGTLSFCIMLTLVLISVRPKGVEKRLGLTHMYEIHAWMAMVLPLTLLIHVFIRWSGLENILDFDLTTASIWGYVGLLSLIVVMLTGIFVLSDTLINKSKKLLNFKANANRNMHLWLHRLAIISVIAIHFHVYNVWYLAENVAYKGLATFYTVVILGWYAVYKIGIARLPKYEIVNISKPSERIHEFKFQPVKGKRMDFDAGQYGFFRFVDSKVDSEAHPFSFASAPSEDSNTMTVMIQEDGDFTSTLDQVKVGDQLTIEGPYGDFYTEDIRDSNQPMVLYSGGIGVTPSLSVLREEVARNSNRRIIFIWGVGFENQLMYYSEFEKFAAEFPNFSHHIIFSNEEVEGFAYGFVDKDYIQSEGLEEYFQSATWHICGPPPMLNAAKKMLEDNSVPEEHVRIEEFAF
ncbi:hypothetical protein HW423_03385 [Aerococcaceae bacterium INB8]|uniref:FAD-binding FR-type domain-containing protein n=1 Tax=Ruoffia halotolerans TaxID=2748684 RepID=A0A839A4Q8_9LACT|nr:FAD-binding oxidoreductase [Ruoffia halotolerans]MBA5728824.1 hypothetical protein [Ruoffia halotolerans]